MTTYRKGKGTSYLQRLWRLTSWAVYYRLHVLPTCVVSNLRLNKKAKLALGDYNRAVRELREAILESYDETKAAYKREQKST